MSHRTYTYTYINLHFVHDRRTDGRTDRNFSEMPGKLCFAQLSWFKRQAQARNEAWTWLESTFRELSNKEALLWKRKINRKLDGGHLWVTWRVLLAKTCVPGFGFHLSDGQAIMDVLASTPFRVLRKKLKIKGSSPQPERLGSGEGACKWKGGM
eukprot:scaffold16894_cov125-Skeletonema_dohrnii-CCMP3373.AAC.1